MSNLLDLPQFPAGMTISIRSNVDWTDQFFASAPGFPADPIVIVGALASNETFTAAPGGVVPGMVATGYGVPDGTIVDGVGSGTITLSAPATITAPGAVLTFLPPPLDLTGISFVSELRADVRAPEVLLALSTADGSMTNGGAGGQFGWQVSAARMLAARWPAALASQGALACVLDVIASDTTGAKVNLCAANGPITVNVSLSITR